MVKRRPNRSPAYLRQTPAHPSSSDDDDSSSDESSKGRSARYSDDSSSTEGDTTSQSEPEPEVITARGRFGIRMKTLGHISLLKMVSSRRPDVDNARNLLSDLTPDGIAGELSAKDSKGNSAIHYACIKALVPWLELIIEKGGDVEVKGAGGRMPIHLVVSDKARSETQAQDKVKMIELLASKGVLVNEKDDLGQTPLQLACNHSKFRGQKMVIRALLSLSDIKVDESVKVGGVNSTLLNIACHNNHFKTALLLLDHGANPLAGDGSKDTPLFIILTKRNVKYALQFLTTCKKKGYNMRQILSVKNVYGRTALHEAIKIGHETLVKYCLDFLAPDDEVDGTEDHDYLLSLMARYDTNVMHTACMKGHLNLSILFHELCPKLLDMKTIKGLTPLHYACRGNYPELAEEICLMIKSHDGELPLSIDDRDVVDGSPSLLKYTALRGSSDCLVVLLKHVEDQSTILKLLEWISAEKNLSKVLKEFLNKFDYISMGNINDDEIERITLLCAAEGQTESLQQFVAWRKAAFLFKDDRNNNIMHLIAQGGHLDTAKAMLKNDYVEFKKGNMLGQTPLHLAIKGGHRELTKLFLKGDKSLAGEKDDSKVTPLMYACQRGDPFNVDLLLKQSQDEIKFFDDDDKGLNCLDHAINNGHERVAVKLLSQEDWRKLLTHSTIEGDTRTTPMRKLIETMPGVGKFVLDKCITRLSDTSTDSKDTCKIKVDYELLEDWFSPWMEDDSLWNTRGRMSLDTMATSGYEMILHTFSQGGPDDTSSGIGTQGSTNFQDDGTLKDSARINVTDAVYRALYHPLRLMIKTDESKELLNHPVVRLLLRHKQKATRLIYWVNFFIIPTLLILVTGHSLFIPPPFYVQAAGDGSNYTWLADGHTKWQDNLDPIALFLFGKVGTWIILTLTVIYFMLFLYRVWVYRLSTLSSIRGLLSILREIGIQVSTILFILPGFSDQKYHDVTLKAEWQWQLGAFAVFLAWFNFILSLQTIPFLGIYVLMFLEVLSTLLNFILVAGIFILSFAVVFCILLSNQVPFHTLADSLGKTLAMMTGEIEYSGVFHNLDYLYKPVPSEDFTSMVFFPISTHIIFVIFIIFMPILIMNLLTGLAVYDIEVIQTKAKMYKRTLEAEAILDLQDNRFMFLWKSSIIKSQVIPVWTRISPWSKLLYKLTGYRETHDQLVVFLEELERTEDESVEFIKTTEMMIEDMAEEMNDISRKLMGLSENVIDIKTQLSMKQ
ncbi:transient receptor potential cation channel subfamily A member 1 homolog [Strongylocentrotus purpuratus]|uniref:Ion transport domain-containing protein n=1 Tax=Strongylocentrotus purpuratus TaxID=7668 RepID=A0A7M7PQC6_STRPU|nr:transient receptor potential cation channel subfamily A member 1 homolog [Strongylocentrotus purpuratus]XP_030852883.1 transient receptor potential cation channel subfamily A member 1 homolog [Strongylocentrotus purpuratus]|eukprot:XP_011670921.1 PREDICTED: transient receptor potential cation channel subfamily A member 1 homolog [Strongylocentrotus purpuratus]